MKIQVREDSPRACRRHWRAGIALLGLILAAPLLASDSISVATHAQRLQIAATDGGVVRWQVSADGADIVLTSEFGNNVHSHHLQVIAGTSAAPPDVLTLDSDLSTTAGSEILSRSIADDTGLRVTRRLQVPEEGFHLRMRLEFLNEGDAPVTVRGPVAGPAIRLGPGLGGQEIAYEGVAASLYDFLNAVLLRVDDSGATVLQLEEEQNELTGTQAVWAGLNNRYSLLAVGAPADMPFTSVRLHRDTLAAEQLMADERNVQHASVLDLDLPVFTLAPGETRAMDFNVYAGAKDISRLSRVEGFDLRAVMFADLWQWMRWLCFALLWIMAAINGVIGNLGVTIILLAVAIRLLLYPLGRAAAQQQLRFNEKQAELKPELERIKAGYTGGEQAERIFELYRRHGVSPAAGVKSLLVVLVQIPVFIALFHILGQAIEFSGAPFLWIDDLARPDHLFSLPFALPYFGSSFNLLPVLMAIVSIIAMGVNRAGDESRGQVVFLVAVNIGFFLIFYHFPAGMVLYWTVANLLHLLQHLLASVRNRTGERVQS